MYKEILIPLDNSKCSLFAIDLGIKISKASASTLTGNHVYAASLHDDRFRQMESGLPPKYQEEQELQRQREIHDSLITRGLQVISDSYLDIFEKRCRDAGVPFRRKAMEGKNYIELVRDIRESNYDLVIIGALGLGEVKSSLIGSVCERVIRRIKTDALIVKNTQPIKGKIAVAIDGSGQSYAALIGALSLSRVFDAEVIAVSAFDPDFHIVAFRSLAGVLSEEAGKVFRFREQEKLHEEIIDKGLAKIYQGHLDMAREIAGKQGTAIKTVLLAGKPFDQILRFIEREDISIMALGRTGVHTAPDLDIGSTTENLLRLAPCHILIASGEHTPEIIEEPRIEKKEFPWTEEALKRLERIPQFARALAKGAIEDYARQKGYREITSDIMDEARRKMGM